MIGTTLRHSKFLIAKRPILSPSTLSPISSNLFQLSSSGTTTNSPPAQQAAFQVLHQQRQFSIKPTLPQCAPTAPLFKLPPAIVEQIKTDLASVDFDSNGKIDADELRALLKRHNTKFTDDEIVELSELFYASSGARSVPMDEFLAALDQAASSESKEGNALGLNKGFKTHPLGIGTCASEYMYAKTHGKYTEEELDVKLTHIEPKDWLDRAAFSSVKAVRFIFDQATGWNRGQITQDKILNRAIYLETIAAIPGMVAAIIRHFRSLRNMTRDGGMLNMFLEEANNERMHLLTFIRMKDPGYAFRAAVIGGQFGFGSTFLVLYMISPAFCHRFVGYVEEEACHTYTKIIDAIENAPEGSDLARWQTEEAPKIAKGYWHLGEHGSVLDLMRAVRADEAEHRDVNHAVSGVGYDTVNPLYDPREKMDGMLKRYVQDMMERSTEKSKPTTSSA
ncbi:hypothetical protein HJC23_004065 [Cyclotella cryptica]|uniref:EF-hand domain-containing protein n=1 Tax=Cyclotella cryptica TaxID=29204 RepID=A0ABD3PJW4_9STRA|eukprot:CCRYP_014055-RA/>CCRYP_014055-RA protein AED:0.06 eAED:0.06 QI:307/1/1/1/1/1/3/282/449